LPKEQAILVNRGRIQASRIDVRKILIASLADSDPIIHELASIGRWFLNVATDHAGYTAVPVSVIFLNFVLDAEISSRLLYITSNPFARNAIQVLRGQPKDNPLEFIMKINPRREHVEAKRMKVVAKLVDRLESNRSDPGGASLFEIRVAVVNEQDL